MAGVFKTLTFLVLVFAATAVLAEDYDVGDDADWTRPTNPQFYTTWAAGKTFRVGDELEFDFTAGRHDVAVVTKNAYDNCVKENPISLMRTPPVKIILNTTGPQYFICTVADHCSVGQKLAINVVGAGGQSGGGGATPAPRAAPGAGGATPTSPPGTTTPPGSSGTNATTPPAGNAASSLGGCTLLVAFVATVVALF